jgi:DNA-binding NarL/FixJ family response regulator
MEFPLRSARGAEASPVPRIRVAVLSDDRLFSEGLLRMLATDESLIPIGLDDTTGLPRALRSPRVDILLLDSRLKGSLIMCTTFMRDQGPSVVFVAADDDGSWAARALDAGARGLLSRRSTRDDLLRAIRAVIDGQIWAPRRVLAARIDQLSGTKAPGESLMTEKLSVRESEVVRHVATGLCNKDLASRLEISQATVKVHLTHIFQKLGVNSRAELVAAYHGVIMGSTT